MIDAGYTSYQDPRLQPPEEPEDDLNDWPAQAKRHLTDKEAIRQLRQLAKDLLHCECFQNADGWTEDYCEESGCKFLIDEDCEVQTRYHRLMDETDPEPDFDAWVRAGMPTDLG